MEVSKPVKVRVGIEDLITGCGYVYSGTTEKDCTDYFLSLFFGKRPYKITSIQYIQPKRTCDKCVHFYNIPKRSKHCEITTRCKGYKNVCDCGKFEFLNPDCDSLEE